MAQHNTQKQNDDNKTPQRPGFVFQNNYFTLFALLVAIGLLLYFVSNRQDVSRVEIPYSQFLEYANQGQVESVQIIDQSRVRGVLKGGDVVQREFRTLIPYFDAALIDLLREKGVRFSGSSNQNSPLRIIATIFPWLLGFFFIWFMLRQLQSSGNKALSFGRSRARPVDIQKQKVGFSDVAGQKEAKYELEEVIDFLKQPEKYQKIGARIPTGILLVGMPGTGKTLLARACAGEAGVNYFQMSGSDFVEMFVGVGASRVRDLFEQGRRKAPCILFIDELDAVGRVRGAGYGGGHDEREQTLNQMLVEMDGFNSHDNIIILAATNRPDVLDPALLRPGRFDRQIVIDMPDIDERQAILKLHTKKLRISKNVDFSRIARATPGCSGADLANLANEAALYAARKNRQTVTMDDFEEARDKILMGVARKSRVLTVDEKKRTAYHESGHALMHYCCKHSDPLHKVTIVPRGRALGLALSLPEEEIYSRGKNWLMDRIKICYGGYVAEEIIYNETSTEAQNDLEQATDLARKMVTQWGMSSLGPISLGDNDEPVFIGREIMRNKDRSDSTLSLVDTEIRKILTECLSQTRKELLDHKKELLMLTTELIERETLGDEDIKSLLNFPAKANMPPLKKKATRKVRTPATKASQAKRTHSASAQKKSSYSSKRNTAPPSSRSEK